MQRVGPEVAEKSFAEQMIVLGETMGAVDVLHGFGLAVGAVRAEADFVLRSFSMRLNIRRGQQGVAVAAREAEAKGQAAFPRGLVGQDFIGAGLCLRRKNTEGRKQDYDISIH